MKITDLLSALQQPTFSFELMPVKGNTVAETLQKFHGLLTRKPLFVDIPYHPDFSKQFSGKKHTVPEVPRPTTEALSAVLLSAYNLPPLAHLLCRNFTPEQTEKALQELAQIGVENVLLLRGDKIKNAAENDFPGHKFAYQLVKQATNFNAGPDLRGNKIPAEKTFCLGVAGYPEMHAETNDLITSLLHLKQKQDAGAHFILTQLFYDNDIFFRFKEACIKGGITIPIIPGIGPLTTKKRLEQLPGFFKVSLPKILQKQVSEITSDETLREIGIGWAKKQTEELLAAGEKLVHFFAFIKPDATEAVVKELFSENKPASS